MSEKVYILHDNEAWLPPFRESLEKAGIEWEEWDIGQVHIDISSEPPQGVFFNRVSPSSQFRGRRYACDFVLSLLSWLEAHDRPIIGSSSAFLMEMNKASGFISLRKSGVRVPDTFVAVGKRATLEAARSLSLRHPGKPFIVKPNRGGSSKGVRRFSTVDELEEELNLLVASKADESHIIHDLSEFSVDGQVLVQEYIRPNPEGRMTRLEFVGGKLAYAVSVYIGEGFDEHGQAASNCPCSTAKVQVKEEETSKFSLQLDHHQEELVQLLESFLQTHDIAIAGIEYIEDENGVAYVHDANVINSNYNKFVEDHIESLAQDVDQLPMQIRPIRASDLVIELALRKMGIYTPIQEWKSQMRVNNITGELASVSSLDTFSMSSYDSDSEQQKISNTSPFGIHFSMWESEEAESYVNELIESSREQKQVLLFSRTTCPFCKKAKRLLLENQIKTSIIELDQLVDGDRIAQAVQHINQRATVPAIFAGGISIGGLEEGPGLVSMLESNTLQSLIHG